MEEQTYYYSTTSNNTMTCSHCGRSIGNDTQSFYLNGCLICGLCLYKLLTSNPKQDE
jgi:predicted  nucleic acid-binding Zn-ribbon protein